MKKQSIIFSVLALYAFQTFATNVQFDQGPVTPKRGGGGTKTATLTSPGGGAIVNASSMVSTPNTGGALNSSVDVYDGKALIGGNSVKWVCQQSTQAVSFTVQRSKNGQTYDDLATMSYSEEKMKDGFVFFDFIDDVPLEGKNYYRILRNDMSGSSAPSRVIEISNHSVNNPNVLADKSSMPIHVNDYTTLELTPKTYEKVQYTISDENGNVVQNGTFKPENFKTYSVDMKEVPSGNYLLRLFHGVESTEVKVLKN